MATDKSKRGAGESHRERESRRHGAAAGTPARETTRASGGTRTRERERDIALTRERGGKSGERRARTPAQENARIATALHDLWNDRAFDRLDRLAAADVECVTIPFGTTSRGVAGYRELLQGWVTAFPDGRTEIRCVIADEHAAVVEYTGRGTHTGPLVTPNGTIPPTGRAGELNLCDVIEIEQGKVQRLRSYYDTGTLMRQLGLAEPGVSGSSRGSRTRTEAG